MRGENANLTLRVRLTFDGQSTNLVLIRPIEYAPPLILEASRKMGLFAFEGHAT